MPTDKKISSSGTLKLGGTIEFTDSAPSLPAGSEFLTTGDQTISGNKTFNNNVIVSGDITVNGTTTTINTATLDVEDANITVNKNGNDTSSQGAGLTVERTGTNGSLVYDSALDSKFKAGNEGSESKILTSSSSISTDASHLGGYGLVPVGAIVAYNPGYYTNGSNGGFAISGPAGNSVPQVNAFLNAKGWYVCNGAAVNVAASPIWNAANRHLPNLDDGRFLRGSTQAGTQGGAATSSIDHTHSVTSNVTVGNHTLTTANLPSHRHGIDHNHAAFNTTSGGSHTHTNARVNAAIGPDYAVADISATNVGYGTWSTSGGAHTHSIDVPNFTGNSGYTGSGTAVTHSVINNAVTTLGASVSWISIEPTYLNTFYIVRVF